MAPGESAYDRYYMKYYGQAQKEIGLFWIPNGCLYPFDNKSGCGYLCDDWSKRESIYITLYCIMF